MKYTSGEKFYEMHGGSHRVNAFCVRFYKSMDKDAAVLAKGGFLK